ncbi:MAG TPA: peptidylprolyl isomerase, partial [Turneriella sp.]|nr:peptidylprolyl isomerase [Turneriella sp.]
MPQKLKTMKKIPMLRMLSSVFFLISLIPFSLWAAPTVLVDTVAIVANEPVTSVDLANEIQFMKKRKGFKKEKRGLESQALDILIGRAIISSIAREEAVTISAERVETQIQKEMDMRGILRQAEFEKIIKRDTGLTLDEYKEEMAHQLLTQQVMQLRVSVPNPTPSQVEEWYRHNKARVGKKYNFRMIYIPVHGNEVQVNKQMKAARAMAGNSAVSFAKAAAKYSAHSSKSRGGLLVDMRLDQIAQIDPILAGAVNGSPVGSVSQVFVGSNGAYYCIRVESARAIGLEEIYDNVRAILYGQ